MDDSILITTKKLLGLDDNYTPFDQDVIVFINGAMMVLQQLGVGPLEGYVVHDAEQTWNDFLPSDTMLEAVKQYIYLYVKMAFDPPASSVVMDAMGKQKAELEWRLREQAEFYPGDGSRLGYWQKNSSEYGENSEVTANKAVIYRGKPPDFVYSSGGFRARGGRYASDPDFPWQDGPSQPPIYDSDGDE